MTENHTAEAASSPVEEVASRGVATFEQLKRKPRRQLTFPIALADEDGEAVTVTMKYQAISPKAYDELIAANPPVGKDKVDGQPYNIDTFAPALIAAVSLEPKLTYEQAKEIYSSPDWAGGEITTLFINAQRVCNTGLDVPFNARD